MSARRRWAATSSSDNGALRSSSVSPSIFDTFVAVVVRERRVGHVVHDADGEMIPRAGVCERVEDPFTMAGVNSLDDRP